MKQLKVVLVLVAGLLLMTGCPSTPEKPDGGAGGAAGRGPGGAQVEGQGAELGGGVSAYSLDDPSSPLSKRVIYFDYDSATIKDEYRQIIEVHGQYLADHPEVQMVMEGHTDERGSREYNIALGEQRTQAVKKIMLLYGATDQQIQTVSFGEERPVAPGHDESAWSLNRRVELVYSQHR
jgi:peptidoglycan-associated lipoprotein